MWGCSADALAPAEGAPRTMSAVDAATRPRRMFTQVRRSGHRKVFGKVNDISTSFLG